MNGLGLRMLGSFGKYAGIIAGAYSVVGEDAPSIGAAFAGTMMYITGDYIKSLVDDERRAQVRQSELEEKTIPG